MRGKEHADEIHHLSPGITPACAGKRSCPLRIRSGHGDHPRACGEKEIEVCPAAAARGSPPRMRGKGGKLPGRVRPQGITPAHAGKRRLPQQSTLCRRDHPRVCGEKDEPSMRRDHPRVCGEKGKRRVHDDRRVGSPPRMRGKVSSQAIEDFEEGITPAYAGKSGTVPRPDALNEDHPRACGEKQFSCIVPLGVLGSPPRMRGKGWAGSPWGSISGITPAHAGKSSPMLSVHFLAGDHPRACGETHESLCRSHRNMGDRGRITPAHAGKRPPFPCPRALPWDHPRACGEKLHCSAHFPRTKGSPPRVRGKADFVY